MRKRVILICICAVLMLSACQPTPEEQIVSQKDDFEELIQNTVSPTDCSETQTSEKEQPIEGV